MQVCLHNCSSNRICSLIDPCVWKLACLIIHIFHGNRKRSCHTFLSISMENHIGQVGDFYICVLSAQDGRAPHFTQKPTITQQKNLLLMTCLLEAKPQPQIRWFRDSTEISSGGRVSITMNKDPGGADLYTVVLQIRVSPLIH